MLFVYLYTVWAVHARRSCRREQFPKQHSLSQHATSLHEILRSPQYEQITCQNVTESCDATGLSACNCGLLVVYDEGACAGVSQILSAHLCTQRLLFPPVCVSEDWHDNRHHLNLFASLSGNHKWQTPEHSACGREGPFWLMLTTHLQAWLFI